MWDVSLASSSFSTVPVPASLFYTLLKAPVFCYSYGKYTNKVLFLHYPTLVDSKASLGLWLLSGFGELLYSLDTQCNENFIKCQKISSFGLPGGGDEKNTFPMKLCELN